VALVADGHRGRAHRALRVHRALVTRRARGGAREMFVVSESVVQSGPRAAGWIQVRVAILADDERPGVGRESLGLGLDPAPGTELTSRRAGRRGACGTPGGGGGACGRRRGCGCRRGCGRGRVARGRGVRGAPHESDDRRKDQWRGSHTEDPPQHADSTVAAEHRGALKRPGPLLPARVRGPGASVVGGGVPADPGGVCVTVCRLLLVGEAARLR